MLDTGPAKQRPPKLPEDTLETRSAMSAMSIETRPFHDKKTPLLDMEIVRPGASLKMLLQRTQLPRVSVLYGCVFMCFIMYNEMLPLYLSEQKLKGGLEFNEGSFFSVINVCPL